MGRFYRERFPGGYKRFQELFGEVRYEFLSLGFLARHISKKRLQRLERARDRPYDVVRNFNGVGLYHNIWPVQVESEILRLFKIVQQTSPSVICEIGTDRGGTLYLWSKVVGPDGLIVSIDLPRTYRKSLNRFFRSSFFGQGGVHFLREDSQRPETKEKLEQKLNGRSIDFLFIDGDHRYEGVKADFELYAPLVREGGIIAFHDILNQGVNRLWKEIRSRFSHEEIVEDCEQQSAGIGVLYC
ncbi:MAG: class I SAM-dependent methyltransferase [Deltaproteobacteria bacterium]|nr:class I SAM-dependent methyltransferase [Deltaproteobacteria bacterium]